MVTCYGISLDFFRLTDLLYFPLSDTCFHLKDKRQQDKSANQPTDKEADYGYKRGQL